MTAPLPSHLPTSRQLLTSLFNAISEIPLGNTKSSVGDDDSTDDENINTSDNNERSSPSGGKDQTPDLDNEAEDELNKRRRKLLPLLKKGRGKEKDTGKDENGRHHQARAGGIKPEDGAGPRPGRRQEGAGNILKQVPLSHRHLIITLHVLFPGLVLPALDLLDHGLVGRIILRKESTPTTKREQDKTTTFKTENDEDVNMDQPLAAGGSAPKQHEKKENNNTPSFYLVRSAQQPPARRRARRRQNHQRYESGDDHGEDDYNGADMGSSNNLFPGSQRAYIVRLEAWNCTCAAFAFASFPSSIRPQHESGPAPKEEQQQQRDERVDGDDRHEERALLLGEGERMDIDIDPPPAADRQPPDLDDPGNPTRQEIPAQGTNRLKGEGEEERHSQGHPTKDEEEWTFGGLSLDPKGVTGGNDTCGSDDDCPPLCKHLLACLLAERWSAALGQYVVERQVTKQEMAGIVAEI